MKRFVILVVTFFLLFFLLRGIPTQAQTTSATDNHTASEEAEGKVIWEKLQAKQLECKNLTNDNFEVLGEYFMGQMAGSSHEVMNNMMVRMMGEEGEKQMHIAMGKRNSGCDTSVGFMPMMGSGWGNMMGWGGVFGIFGWITMIIFWLLLILGIIALIRYLGSPKKSSDKDKSPLDILKERYARGEISKKEFEEMKKEFGIEPKKVEDYLREWL